MLYVDTFRISKQRGTNKIGLCSNGIYFPFIFTFALGFTLVGHKMSSFSTLFCYWNIHFDMLHSDYQEINIPGWYSPVNVNFAPFCVYKNSWWTWSHNTNYSCLHDITHHPTLLCGDNIRSNTRLENKLQWQWWNKWSMIGIKWHVRNEIIQILTWILIFLFTHEAIR